MKVMNFVEDGQVRLGLVTSRGVIDVSAAAAASHVGLPGTMEELMAAGSEGLKRLGELEKGAIGTGLAVRDPDRLTYAPVVTRPEKILCIGWNYLAHLEESKTRTDLPKYPEVFSVANNALSAHRQPIKLPPTASNYDYEAELVIVIGKECSMVSEEDALRYVFGYTCGNDFSERVLQKRNTQWFLAKSLDGFAPVGPWIVTADSIDPSNLNISMKRGGETVQSSNTRNLLFGCAYLVSYISSYLTLRPGDLIFTGTPSGVILGLPPEKQRWITAGEKLTVSIEGIGDLVNTTI